MPSKERDCDSFVQGFGDGLGCQLHVSKDEDLLETMIRDIEGDLLIEFHEEAIAPIFARRRLAE